MCWNQDISINTFIFSCLALIFIYYTNTFTRYKTPLFDNPMVYLFFLSGVSMQLIEFFLWRNLKNKFTNKYLSKLASFIVTLQIFFLILIIPTLSTRYRMLFIYSIFLLTYLFYKKMYSPVNFYTSIGKNGHLSWEWINLKGYESTWFFIFLLFYIIPIFIIDDLFLKIFVIISIFTTLFFYYKDNTFGTMWCWISNLFLLFLIINILIIQPYYEYNGLC
jgi:hypothetical protein